MIKKTAAIVILFLLMCTGCSRQSEGQLYDLEEYAQYNLFINYVDGYELRIGKDFSADMSCGEIVTVLENDDTRMEIYKQELGSVSADVYLSYSNRFLDNTMDHTLDHQEVTTSGGKDVHIFGWHRDKLQNVDSDRNYYFEMDVVDENAVYTILIKTENSIEDPAQYTDLLKHLKFFEPSASAPVWNSNVADLESKQWNEETKALYTAFFDRQADLKWGIFEFSGVYGGASGGKFEELNAIEERIGYEFSVSLTYLGFLESPVGKLDRILETTWEEGKVLELTLQAEPTADGGNMTYDILQGQYDGILTDYARIIKAFGHPVLFRPFNEMNGDWCLYSGYHTAKDTEIYKALYRYVYQLFEREQVDNVIWIWNPNEGSFPNFDWNHTLLYYPGDEYVDVVGMTAYNTGTYYEAVGEKWSTFSELYDGLYAWYCGWFSQPLMITEFACAVRGGDKAAWVEDMFEQLEKYDRIKVAVWWDHVDYDPTTDTIARDYRIEEPAEVLDVFRNHLS